MTCRACLAFLKVNSESPGPFPLAGPSKYHSETAAVPLSTLYSYSSIAECNKLMNEFQANARSLF